MLTIRAKNHRFSSWFSAPRKAVSMIKNNDFWKIQMFRPPKKSKIYIFYNDKTIVREIHFSASGSSMRIWKNQFPARSIFLREKTWIFEIVRPTFTNFYKFFTNLSQIFHKIFMKYPLHCRGYMPSVFGYCQTGELW